MGSPIVFNGANAKMIPTGNILDSTGAVYARGLSVVYQTASATAVQFTNYQCNTTSAAFTMTLPTGAAGYVIRFTDDASTWATNNLTIAPAAAQTIQGITSSGSLVCNLSGAFVELSWDATNSYWVVAASGFQYGPTYSPGVTGGIIPSSGLPGATAGTAIGATTVGQILTNTATGSLAYTATNTTNFINLSLTAGVWLVTGSFGGYTPSGAAVMAVALNTTSASLGSAGLNYNEYLVGTAGAFVAPAPSYYVNVSATTNVYLVGFGSAGTTTAVGSAYMQAVRVA